MLGWRPQGSSRRPSPSPGQVQSAGLRTEPECMARRVWESRKHRGLIEGAGKAGLPGIRAGRQGSGVASGVGRPWAHLSIPPDR